MIRPLLNEFFCRTPSNRHMAIGGTTLDYRATCECGKWAEGRTPEEADAALLAYHRHWWKRKEQA